MEFLTVCQASGFENKQLDEYLRSWGLRRFDQGAAYDRWQQDSLTGDELSDLNRLAQDRSEGRDPSADTRFYDLAAQPKILSVLYSQHYDYYLAVGRAIADRIEPAKHVLDFGCGVGILTTFFATVFPHVEFLGVDRSPASISVAREQAARRGLRNVRFEQCQIPNNPIPGCFDLIICSHALFQAEGDPGLPSMNWKTFERGNDPAHQIQAEARTGLKDRLESLSSVLSPNGRMLLCEKAQHLGRRVLLQRALHARGFQSIAHPVAFRYRAIDETIEDGPLYEVSRESTKDMYPWEEEPFLERGQSIYTCQGSVAQEFISSMSDAQSSQSVSVQSDRFGESLITFGKWNECLAYGFVGTHSGFCGAIVESLAFEQTISPLFTGIAGWTGKDLEQIIGRLWPHRDNLIHDEASPCYENHTPSAQLTWASLPARQVKEEATFQENDGREKHIEFGTCGPFGYVYWSNTYDQRQLVLTTVSRLPMLEEYYRESLGGESPIPLDAPTSRTPL